jgi:hypothetical protein
MHADARDGHDQAEHRRQAVARRGRRDPDSDARRVPDGVALEALVQGACFRRLARHGGVSHALVLSLDNSTKTQVGNG